MSPPFSQTQRIAETMFGPQNHACGTEVWVVGDAMLDEYWVGPIERLAPEAPIPVMRVDNQRHALGGAANVAHGIVALGGRAVLGALVGNDAAGNALRELCRSAGIESRAVLQTLTRPTTRKIRVGAGKPLIRLDFESTGPLAELEGQRCLAELANGAKPQAIILSDYAKGMLPARFVDTALNLN